MIEHVSVSVRDMKKAKAFYDKALKPLGYRPYRDFSPDAIGYLEGGSTSFWIVRTKEKITTPTHVALRGKSKKAVDDFHTLGVKAGGKDNGAPGFRLPYGNNYYASFLHDADGNNIEACYFGAKAPKQKITKKK